MSDSIVRRRRAYGTIPRDLLRDPAISAQAKTLYALLDDFASPNQPEPFPGKELLAELLGVTTRTIFAWTKELTEAGWLTVERRDGTSNLYCLEEEVRKPASRGVRKPASYEGEPDEGEPSEESSSSPPVGSRARRTPRRKATREAGEPSVPPRPPSPRRSPQQVVRNAIADLQPTDHEIGELIAWVRDEGRVRSLFAFAASPAGREDLARRLDRIRGSVVYNPADIILSSPSQSVAD